LILQGSFVPFHIEKKKLDHLQIKLEWINSPEKVDEFTPIAFYILQDSLNKESLSGNEELALLLEGYTLVDQDSKHIGLIKKVEKYPYQILLSVQLQNKQEALIPFSEDLLIEVNGEDREIKMEIPEGLVDLNE